MSKQKTNTRNAVLLILILFAVVMRVVNTQLPFLSNFTPVGAMALFGGAYYTDKLKAFLVPLFALLLSDMIINGLVYHVNPFAISYGMYACFIIMVFFGTLIKKVTFTRVAAASVASVLVHWLVMDLPFLYGAQYSHDLNGYVLSLTRAIPFERNMLIADAIYGAILFGGFELAKRKFVVLRSTPELAL